MVMNRSIAIELLIVPPEPHDLLFRSLADPTRRAIFERLCRQGEQTVAGLVRDRPQGRQTHYRAELAALAPLTDWTSEMTSFWRSRFDDLEDLLKRMDQ